VPERTPLDLSGILDLYQGFLPSREDTEAMRKVQEPDDSLRYEIPVRLGWGPDRWSTSMALVPVVRVCHDVNGYYRELEVDWRASRKELMQAYMAQDGQSSVRLTYVFKQLLDPLIREAYDKSPKGEPFLDDYTQDDLKRKAHIEAARRSTLGQTVTPDEVLDEMGYVSLDDETGVDTVRASRQDSSQRKEQGLRYSYYAWKTEDFVQNEARIQKWQESLSRAAGIMQCPAMKVSIGFTSAIELSDRPFIIEVVREQPVIFFHTDVDPDLEIALFALGEFLSFSKSTQFPSH
jgi:hypothetical protein